MAFSAHSPLWFPLVARWIEHGCLLIRTLQGMVPNDGLIPGYWE